ncbi:hypothetical protein PFICI_01324 [Pestalotiopsis fici W106-1]|uniref:Ubiquitin-conjugating enzyme E2C-binding protein n=1 Tax=Pestalotiopsis fici (strain W106-1 / CGMCC3.15140) TaxID=1229662 RepID=W3XQF3_PESFW|nr:uncharacterized protein PFICI_01324 [Pestalotiopsis fici W106-1]ETS87496.1 hypothetical protein PFICI_01324 [Pestalotiopsis fici W106-1]
MSGPPRIVLYAELLSNIRQVSVGCSLSSACATTTEASLSPDGQQLTVRHEGEECAVQLPGKVSAPTKLPMQTRDSRNLSWRLPLAGAAPMRFIPPSQLDSQTVAWSASELPVGGIIKCRDCQAMVIGEGTINAWKDLPSENWAEMMEFWHCHKPDNADHDHLHGQTESEEHLAGRGYGANSRIAGKAGTGFVDLSSLLFLEKDCANLTPTETNTASKESSSSTKHGSPVTCSKCSSEIGAIHVETSSVTLYKWQVTISSPESKVDLQPQPTLANCVASMLASTLSRSGCSKSIILPIGASSSSLSQSGESLLHIWLFNGNISFTSSVVESKKPIPAVKVLYRFVTKAEADRLSDSITSDVQEITLPIPAVRGLRHLLERSNQWLPSGDRLFREWTVGLLEKWNA